MVLEHHQIDLYKPFCDNVIFLKFPILLAGYSSGVDLTKIRLAFKEV